MKTFTNHTAGPRGINLEGGTTLWLEPGESVELDPATINGEMPDLGKPADAADKLDAANAELTEQVTALEGQVADLQGKLDAANAELLPYKVKDAVAGLDPTKDEHWTKAGLPSTEAVSVAVGSDVTRAQIEAIVPDAKRAA